MVRRSPGGSGLLFLFFDKLRNQRDHIRFREHLFDGVGLFFHPEFFQFGHAVFLPRGFLVRPRIFPGEPPVHLRVQSLIPGWKEHAALHLFPAQSVLHPGLHFPCQKFLQGNLSSLQRASICLQRRQDPVQITVRAGQFQIAQFLFRRRFRLQELFSCHAGQDQLLFRAGHGHIEDPQFFSQIVQLVLPAYHLFDQRGPAHTVFQVHIVQPDSVPAVADQLVPALLPVETFPHARGKYHREFQSFAVMDTHDLHGSTVRARQRRLAEIHLVFLHLLYIPDKMKQPVIADLLVILRFLKQHLHIGDPLLPARERPHLVHISGLFHDLPQEFMDGRARRPSPVLFHPGEEIREPFL